MSSLQNRFLISFILGVIRPMQKSFTAKEYQLFLAFLKKARRGSELTQEQLAKKLKAAQSFISKAECGERRLDVVELRWCRTLGLSLTDFTAGFESYLKRK